MATTTVASIMAKAAAESVTRQQRFDGFVNMVKNRPGEYISSAETATNLGVSKATIHKYWDKIPEVLGGSTERCKGLGIQWVPPVVEKTTMKNSEGYMDTTAQKAIAKVDREAEVKKKTPACGEVWLHTSSGGKINYIYVVRTFYDHTLSLVLEKGEPPIGYTFYPISLKGSAESYYVDISKISIKMLKYSTDFIEFLGGDTYIDIRKEVANLFGGADDAYSALGKLKKELDAEKEARKKAEANFVAEKQENIKLNNEIKKFSMSHGEHDQVTAKYISTLQLNLKEVMEQRDGLMAQKENLEQSLKKALEDRIQPDNKLAMKVKLLEAQLKVYEEAFNY